MVEHLSDPKNTLQTPSSALLVWSWLSLRTTRYDLGNTKGKIIQIESITVLPWFFCIEYKHNAHPSTL